MSRILLIKNIYLSQSDYINKIFNIFRLENLSPRDILIESKFRLIKTKAGEKNSNKLKKQYQVVIGSLVWAFIQTRPNIIYSISVLGQFIVNPIKSYYTGTKHVL